MPGAGLLPTPRGTVCPSFQRCCGPSTGLICVAEVAGVGDLQCLRLLGPDETKGVTADVHIVDGFGDLRHVASNALAASTSRCVMGVLLDRCGMRTVLGIGTVAAQAQSVSGRSHHGRIVVAMGVMAAKAGNPTCVHQARDKIIALHAVLVRSPVRKMGEGG